MVGAGHLKDNKAAIILFSWTLENQELAPPEEVERHNALACTTLTAWMALFSKTVKDKGFEESVQNTVNDSACCNRKSKRNLGWGEGKCNQTLTLLSDA